MTKNDLINAVAKRTGLKKTDIDLIINVSIDETKKSIAKNEPVYLRGFGTFTAKHRKEKTARNISAGTQVIVPETAVPHFKPCNAFKVEVHECFTQKIY